MFRTFQDPFDYAGDPRTLACAIGEVIDERCGQCRWWGEQDYPAIPPEIEPELACDALGIPSESECKQACDRHAMSGTLTWADLVLDEFAEAVSAPDEAIRRNELVQLAACAIAWIECIDRHAGDASDTGELGRSDAHARAATAAEEVETRDALASDARPFPSQPVKPLVSTLPDGRIAVYIGSAYQYLTAAQALGLREKLGRCIQQAVTVKKEAQS
jgi:hypothetical protein